MKYTMKQIKKWNSKMGNGFRTDLQNLMVWNEKTPHKMVEISENEKYEISLIYCDEYKTVTNKYGCTYNVQTGKYIPNVHVQHWKRENADRLFSSIGLGKYVPVGEAQDKKMFSTLQKLTHTVNADEYI